ncbi:GIY-YIG nuclease family protein [Phenylobacterium aquaticum]|uniref:GIY-YIG nuclease family protein n=1 Tax=Phenylobacterium aquaticum TaxID=1763816 RepID=UPI0026F18E37|nr:GIY-YIG nuclease family protein [Phenylobacterium aquaticum]
MEKSRRRDMVQAYKEAKTPFGVFGLRCLPTDELWIGASPNLAAQENAVRFTLKMGKHPNRGLQAAIQAHGPAAFAYEIVETLDDQDLSPMGKSDLLKRRVVHWIEALAAKPLIGAA